MASSNSKFTKANMDINVWLTGVRTHKMGRTDRLDGCSYSHLGYIYVDVDVWETSVGNDEM